jgi:hypothetical protein
MLLEERDIDQVVDEMFEIIFGNEPVFELNNEFLEPVPVKVGDATFAVSVPYQD